MMGIFRGIVRLSDRERSHEAAENFQLYVIGEISNFIEKEFKDISNLSVEEIVVKYLASLSTKHRELAEARKTEVIRVITEKLALKKRSRFVLVKSTR